MLCFLSNWWDVIVMVLAFLINLFAWREVKKKAQNTSNAEERNLSATTLGTASTAGITAVSILIPAAFLIIQLSKEKPLPPVALDHIFRSSIYFFTSLIFGLFLMFLIPMRSHKVLVTHNLGIGICFGPQLVALLIGMVHLLIGLYYTIYSK